MAKEQQRTEPETLVLCVPAAAYSGEVRASRVSASRGPASPAPSGSGSSGSRRSRRRPGASLPRTSDAICLRGRCGACEERERSQIAPGALGVVEIASLSSSTILAVPSWIVEDARRGTPIAHVAVDGDRAADQRLRMRRLGCEQYGSSQNREESKS